MRGSNNKYKYLKIILSCQICFLYLGIKYKIMIRKFEYGFMIVAALSAISSIFMGLASKTSIGWQAISLLWIFICIMKQVTIDKIEKKINKDE